MTYMFEISAPHITEDGEEKDKAMRKWKGVSTLRFRWQMTVGIVADLRADGKVGCGEEY